jgi:hypothetical protein
VTAMSDLPGGDAAGAPASSKDSLVCLRRHLEDSFPGGRFATEVDPIILAVAAMGSIWGVLNWSLRQVEAYHPETPSLIPLGLVESDLPTLRAAYSALLSEVGATYPAAMQQADPEYAGTARFVRDALSSLHDVIVEISALLASKRGFPSSAPAMTVRELGVIVGRLGEARLGIATALGWSKVYCHKTS